MARRERFRAERTLGITESVIREMSRLAIQHGAVNLAQGYPDFSAPEILKEAPRRAVTEDINQYTITWGAKPFRDAIAAKYQREYGLEIDPEHEIYEHIVYDGARHVPMMSIPGMRDRTVLINSMSKTYSVTGWRVGWVLAAPDLAESVRKVHDFLTVGAAAPLQQGGVVALGLGEDYYAAVAREYT